MATQHLATSDGSEQMFIRVARTRQRSTTNPAAMTDAQATQSTTTTTAAAVTAQSTPTADASDPVTKPESLSEKIHRKVWRDSRWARDAHNKMWNPLK